MRRHSKLASDNKPAAAERATEDRELLRDVQIAMQQIERGKGLSNREAKAELRRRFAR